MVNITSEIGRLRRALVHEPGLEVDRMVPAMMEQLLFDDILYGDRARDEHARFRRVLQLLGVEVLEAADLLAQALEDDQARKRVVDTLLEDLSPPERDRLSGLDPVALTEVLIAGSRELTRPSGIEAEDLYGVVPLPNWCFQRDPQVILGDGVILCSMAAPARHREALLTRAVFRFHPDFKNVPVLFDPVESAREHLLYAGQGWPHIEGGDVLIFSESVIAVGLSERTNRNGIKFLARALAQREDGPRYMLVVELPRRRAYMHLDTLITQVDRDACLVYPPVILPGGREQASVSEIDLRSDDLEPQSRGNLLESLAARGVELEPINCGGDDPVAQQREQWTDGANCMALAPGVITLFGRNTVTAEALSQKGFAIVEAEDLLLGRREIDLDANQRVCILIRSNEISRARGGPHCLVHPLLRD
ncbi:MAG: hypothetical protein GY716_11185 [bacterium]|nr:hypothetical protein [bacterium]